jgi:hypothetical protein
MPVSGKKISPSRSGSRFCITDVSTDFLKSQKREYILYHAMASGCRRTLTHGKISAGNSAISLGIQESF